MKPVVKFEVGKYYENDSGIRVFVLALVRSEKYGLCLIAESNDPDEEFHPLDAGENNGATDNFYEISREKYMEKSTWMDLKEETLD